MLGLHLSENEGANYWLIVLADLNNRAATKEVAELALDELEAK